MSSSTLSKPLRAHAYWIGWLIILACVLLLRFVIPVVAPAFHVSHLALLYALSTWLPLMALHLVHGRRLVAHLKTHHYDRWEYLTWAFGRAGGRNDFRMLPWLLSAEDYGDAALAALKSEQRRILLLGLVVFLSFPLLTPILDA